MSTTPAEPSAASPPARPSTKFRPGLTTFFTAWAGGPVGRRLAHGTLLLPKIETLGRKLSDLSDTDLRRESLSLRYRAKSGEPPAKLLPEAYALVREASRRKLGMIHFDVQMLAGIALEDRALAEMETGEGKTLTASLPLYLNALSGRGAMLATVNDYLAARDADIVRPLFELLGMTVGVIEAKVPPNQRHGAYACDVIYGTAKEFGFDFLRDQLLLRSIRQGQTDLLGKMLGITGGAKDDKPMQRSPHFILVDEADSILIDEARTPLIISAIAGNEENRHADSYRWASAQVKELKEVEHYTYDAVKQGVELTLEGRHRARSLKKPANMDNFPMAQIYEFLERAIRAERAFQLDKNYVVKDGEIVIVDESTGRLAEGRKWRDGLHQAIEAKNGVKVTVDTGQAARVTVQDFFLRFDRLAGMSGTAASSSRELKGIYKLQVVPVPTNRPCIRQRLPWRIFGTAEARWAAVVEDIRECHERGQPVLIGTQSIERSEHLSKMLDAVGIGHQVLNARHLAAEAAIVALAGQMGRVTVSTNMAGRGTDIKLGPGVAELGGLHVIGVEMNESARIDRQLYGRCARQGDPGTYRVFLSLEDVLLLFGLGKKACLKWRAYGAKHPGELSGMDSLFRKAQRSVERRHYRDRKILLHYERERRKMQIEMGQDPHLDTPS